MRSPSPVPPAPAFVPCARSAPLSPRGCGPEGLVTKGRPSRLQMLAEEDAQEQPPAKGPMSPCRVLAGERSELCESLLAEIWPPAQGLGAFFPCQGDVPCLDPLVSLHGLAPAQPAHGEAATLASACPGLLCGGEPDGQGCLAERPPSSLASGSCSRLGRCPRPLLLPGPGPVRLRARAGRVPCHCPPVPFSSWSVWT